jgi:hypothetical protein
MNSNQDYSACAKDMKNKIYKESSNDDSLYDSHIYDNQTIAKDCYIKANPIIEAFSHLKKYNLKSKCLKHAIKILLVLIIIALLFLKFYGSNTTFLLKDIGIDMQSNASVAETVNSVMQRRL